MMFRSVCVLVIAGLCLAHGAEKFDERVRQNFDTKLNSLLVQQIQLELKASYVYQAYSHYFGRADVALPGFAKWFEKSSIEERGHATTLIEYVNKRGGSVSLGDLAYGDACTLINQAFEKFSFENTRSRACICHQMSYSKALATKGECDAESTEWKNGLWAMQDTLVLEKYVNQQLLDLRKAAENDAHLCHVLEHEFLDEQVEAIKTVGDYVRKLERVGTGLGEYMFDKDL